MFKFEYKGFKIAKVKHRAKMLSEAGPKRKDNW